MELNWQQIDESEILLPGDTIRQVYTIEPTNLYYKAYLIKQVEDRIEQDPRLKLFSTWFPYENDEQRIMFEIEVVQPDEPSMQYAGVFTVAIVVALIIGGIVAAIFGTMKMEQTYKHISDAKLAETTEGREILKIQAEAEKTAAQAAGVNLSQLMGAGFTAIFILIFVAVLGKSISPSSRY